MALKDLCMGSLGVCAPADSKVCHDNVCNSSVVLQTISQAPHRCHAEDELIADIAGVPLCHFCLAPRSRLSSDSSGGGDVCQYEGQSQNAGASALGTQICRIC